MKDLAGLFDGVKPIHPESSIMRNTFQPRHFSQVEQLTLIMFPGSIFCCCMPIKKNS